MLPGWLALATAPLMAQLWRARAVLVARLVAAGLAGLYVTLLATGLAGEGPPEGASFTTLEGVRLLLASEAALVAGWVHYLVFDLWVGSWEAEDAGRHGVPHVLLLPCLVLTLMAGPTGLLLYLLIRLRYRA